MARLFDPTHYVLFRDHAHLSTRAMREKLVEDVGRVFLAVWDRLGRAEP